MHGHVTAEELAAALPHVLAAPADGAAVEMLCVRPAHNARLFPGRITLSKDGGVAGDFETAQPWLRLADGRMDPRIQVSVLPSRVLDLVWRNREALIHPGDTIIADINTSEANLPDGARLKAGTAILRVSGIWNSGCAKWRARYGVDAWTWVSNPAHEKLRLRGVLCAVEQGGEIALGDRIVKL